MKLAPRALSVSCNLLGLSFNYHNGQLNEINGPLLEFENFDPLAPVSPNLVLKLKCVLIFIKIGKMNNLTSGSFRPNVFLKVKCASIIMKIDTVNN